MWRAARRSGSAGSETRARGPQVGGLDGEACVRLSDLVRERVEALALGELLRDDV